MLRGFPASDKRDYSRPDVPTSPIRIRLMGIVSWEKSVPLNRRMIDSNTDNQSATAQTHFRDYLKSRGIRYTMPRQQILEAVLNIEGHFEAEQLLFTLRQKGQRVGKATIYRTLPLLVDCGILKEVRFDVKQAHYRKSFGEQTHDHLVCAKCGRIVEFPSDDVLTLRNTIAKEHRFKPVSHRFQISGICWECSQSSG